MNCKRLFAAIVLLLSACQRPEATLHEYSFFAFGTLVEVSIWEVDEAKAKHAARTVEQDFAGFDKDWHAWRPSALTETNRQLASGQVFIPPPSVIPLVEHARPLSRSSHGLFDPAIGKLIELWGFHSDEPPKAPPDAQAITDWLAERPSLADLEINEGMWRSKNPTVQLDFGAHAKGYAIDRTIEHLKALGIHNALVNAGGDLRAIGRAGNRPWRIGIRHPRAAGVIASLEITGDESVLTSGDYERFFMHEGKRYHHIFDPRTGYPAEGSMSVTVIHKEAAKADAAATAIFVAGSREWQIVARDMAVDQVMLIDAQGRIHLTPGMQERLRFEIDTRNGIPADKLP